MVRRIRRILRVENPGSVLDVGCGPGVEYEGIVRAGLSVRYTGVDVTSQMIDVAKSKFPDAKWIVGDIYDLPFPDRSFELVMCRAVLEHLPDYTGALKELNRVARRLVLITLYRKLTLEPSTIRFESRFPNIESPFVSFQFNLREFMTSLWQLEPVSIHLDRLEDGDIVLLRKHPAPLDPEV